MAAPSKTQLLNDVYTLLKKHYKLEPRAERLSVLESIIYGICHEGTTREQAEQALSRFREQFFDWNEVRVSSIEEIQDVLAGQDDAEERANRLRRFLRQLFEKTYDFTLDGLSKKPLKDSVALLKEYDAMESDYVLATVIQQGLGGHALPVDVPIRRGLARLGVVREADDPHEVRSHLERAVPKNRGTEFVDLMEELTHDTCVAGPPDCPRCDLRKICPTGQARLVADKAAARSAARGKPTPPPPPPAPAAKATTKTPVAKAAPAPAPPPAKPAAKARPTPTPTKSAPAKGKPGGGTAPGKAAKGRSPKSK
jgi:endonuclease III